LYTYNFVGNLRYEAFLEAQTVHLEIKYIGSVTFDGNNTVVSFANDQTAQRIELTKNKGGNTGFGLNSFGFGILSSEK